MRKYILLLFVGIFLLSGCGNKEVVCTGEEDLEGENVKAEIVAKLKDDKVDTVSATMIFDSEDSANQSAVYLIYIILLLKMMNIKLMLAVMVLK